MLVFWDDLNFHYNELNAKESRKLNRKSGRLKHVFKNPHQIALEEVVGPEGEKEKYADGTSVKYVDTEFQGFKKFKKDRFWR